MTSICRRHLLPAPAAEHRPYQADWLLRYYRSYGGEIPVSTSRTSTPRTPGATGAAPPRFSRGGQHGAAEALLRVPGIVSKARCAFWRRAAQPPFGMEELRRMGVVLKRAQ